MIKIGKNILGPLSDLFNLDNSVSGPSIIDPSLPVTLGYDIGIPRTISRSIFFKSDFTGSTSADTYLWTRFQNDARTSNWHYGFYGENFSKIITKNWEALIRNNTATAANLTAEYLFIKFLDYKNRVTTRKIESYQLTGVIPANGLLDVHIGGKANWQEMNMHDVSEIALGAGENKPLLLGIGIEFQVDTQQDMTIDGFVNVDYEMSQTGNISGQL